MNLKITGLHLEVTPSIREYIESKLERITRHVDNVIGVNVTLSVDKLVQKAEVNVHLAGKDIHVESEEADMYAAIDTLMDKLDRQVLKFKEKQGEHRVNAQQVNATLQTSTMNKTGARWLPFLLSCRNMAIFLPVMPISMLHQRVNKAKCACLIWAARFASNTASCA